MNNNMPAKGGSAFGGKILIISIDRGLLGKGQLGDVIERHRKYGEYCDQIDLIVLSKNGFDKYKISDNVTAYPTNSCCKLKYYCDAYKLGKKLFEKNKYDLVITQTPFVTGFIGLRLKKKFGVKLLVHFHGDFWQNKNWLCESKLNWLFLLVSKFVVPRADAIRVMSEGQVQKINKLRKQEIKIRVISTPVDLSKFNVEDRKLKSAKDKVILHIGRDDIVKDYKTLIEAMVIVQKQLPNVKLVQAGADREIKKYTDLNHDLNHDLKNMISKEELVNLYNQADVFVSSSTSESFGKVMVEANACGKPVVSTATTGAKEIIQDGYNGFLVPIGNVQALADKIIYLLNNPEKAEEMGENGRKLVKEKYGDNTQKIIKFWQDIINNK